MSYWIIQSSLMAPWHRPLPSLISENPFLREPQRQIISLFFDFCRWRSLALHPASRSHRGEIRRRCNSERFLRKLYKGSACGKGKQEQRSSVRLWWSSREIDEGKCAVLLQMRCRKIFSIQIELYWNRIFLPFPCNLFFCPIHGKFITCRIVSEEHRYSSCHSLGVAANKCQRHAVKFDGGGATA